ncbi:MAG: NAD(+)/NADH kinase [Chloroflexota bacterium]|nr:MAG: NAD(+)/NADH kinase [Chloroflexota bacterium]
MSGQLRIPQHLVVLAHPSLEEAYAEAEKIASFLVGSGARAAYGSLYDEALCKRVRENEFDAMIALGGDGTMLRAGHLAAPHHVPILGINLGRFGFLIEVRQNNWKDYLPRLFQGDYWLENRMMLCAEQWREDQMLGSWDVLNEVVVSRGQIVRPVHLITHVDGRFLTTYVADGLIASTPTGSTAYALAAGGPILPPELRNILIVPVAPHLSIDRAIVLAEGSSVSVIVKTDHQAVLSVDGQPPVELADNDRVDAHAAEHTIQFIRFQDPGYFYRNLTPHMNQNPSTGNHR